MFSAILGIKTPGAILINIRSNEVWLTLTQLEQLSGCEKKNMTWINSDVPNVHVGYYIIAKPHHSNKLEVGLGLIQTNL